MGVPDKSFKIRGGHGEVRDVFFVCLIYGEVTQVPESVVELLEIELTASKLEIGR